jgi:hypothetical protein
VYELFVALTFFKGDIGHGPGFILNLSHLVIPCSRVIFIYITLVKQAGGRV